MNFEIFNNNSFLEELDLAELIKKQKHISIGSIIELSDKKYCVNNIIISDVHSIILEVSS